MDIHLHLIPGWFILPLIFTFATAVWLRLDRSYYEALAGGFFFLIWLVANLAVWLIYAACAAIFNIF